MYTGWDDMQHKTDLKNPSTPTGWTFLTNHAHVFLVISRDPDSRIREIADQVGITERAAHRIISELVSSGYLSRTRVGRENRYKIDSSAPLRHPLESQHTVGKLIELLSTSEQTSAQ